MTHLEIFPKWMVYDGFPLIISTKIIALHRFPADFCPSPPLPSRATHSCFPVPNAKDRIVHPSNKYPRCPKNRRSPKGSTQQPRLNRQRNHWLKYWLGIKVPAPTMHKFFRQSTQNYCTCVGQGWSSTDMGTVIWIYIYIYAYTQVYNFPCKSPEMFLRGLAQRTTKVFVRILPKTCLKCQFWADLGLGGSASWCLHLHRLL